MTDSPTPDGPTMVDPRAPRFGQAITATGLLLGVGLAEPLFVFLIAAVLAAAVLSGWRIDAYAWLWRHGVRRFAAPPDSTEPAAPHRFARVLGAAGTVGASALLLAGATTVGFALALAIAALAALAAVTGICLGCRMYRQVSFLRRHDVV